MDASTLIVRSSEQDLKILHGFSQLHDEVRFNVTNEATFVWETNVEFDGPTMQDVNGGGGCSLETARPSVS